MPAQRALILTLIERVIKYTQLRITSTLKTVNRLRKLNINLDGSVAVSDV